MANGIKEFAGFLSEEKADKMKKAILDHRKESVKLNLEKRNNISNLFH
jgi:hypothetical protein